MKYQDLRECYEEADRRMKEDRGHSFIKILKTRCQYCGRSPDQTKGKKCGGWFNSFLDQLSIVLEERKVIEP